MKILIITKTIAPDSGWGRYSSGVIEELNRQGMECLVLTERNGILPTRSVFNFLRNILVVRGRANDFDIIHAFDGWPYAVYGYFATLGRQKKLFINAVGTYSIAPLGSFLKGIFLRIAYRKADAVFAISDYIKGRLLEKMPDLKNITTVYLGLTPLPVLDEGEIQKYKKRFYILNQNPILLTVGEIKERKGQFDTLQAVLVLREKFPNILYLIVGSDKDSAYAGKIRRFISDNSLEENAKIINDARYDKELSFFYTISTIFLLNSRNDDEHGHFEGFGLAMLEAASFGKPVVGSLNCGVAEAMKDGYNGYLANQADSVDIAQKVEKTLAGNYQSLSENSKSFVRRFTWQKTVSEYLRHYHTI